MVNSIDLDRSTDGKVIIDVFGAEATEPAEPGDSPTTDRGVQLEASQVLCRSYTGCGSRVRAE